MFGGNLGGRVGDAVKQGEGWFDGGGMSMQLPSVISTDSLSQFSQSMAQDKASFAVAKKTLDVQRSQGDAAVSLLKQAADFAVGSKAINGHGGHIDGYA